MAWRLLDRLGMDRTRVRELEATTRKLTLDVIRLSRSAGRDPSLWPVLTQLVRAAGSVSANHLAVSGARSNREFFAKLCIAHEEAAETVHWLSILVELDGSAPWAGTAECLLEEAQRLRNFFSRARATTRKGLGIR